jgi:hypothetical protein
MENWKFVKIDQVIEMIFLFFLFKLEFELALKNLN